MRVIIRILPRETRATSAAGSVSLSTLSLFGTSRILFLSHLFLRVVEY